MKAIAIKKVNQRLDANTGSQKLIPIQAGDIIDVIGIEEGEFYRGSNRWLLKDDGTKTWAGAYNINYGSGYIKQFGIDQLWNISTGNGIKVGVIDSEINIGHISLKNCPIIKHEINSPDSIHGTYMAAIIGARNIKDGFVGMAPSCELHAASYAKEGNITPKEVLEAFESLSNAHIINLSFATNNKVFSAVKNPVGLKINQLINSYVASGKIVLAATGNNYQQTLNTFFYYPSYYSGTISIAGGYTKDGNYFIEKKSNVWNGVDLIGPVNNFFNIIPQSSEIFQNRTNGNSVTTAMVSGLLALIYDKLKAKNLLNKQQILDLISIPVSAKSENGFLINTRWLSESKIKQLINL